MKEKETEISVSKRVGVMDWMREDIAEANLAGQKNKVSTSLKLGS